jgi:hypothetical protein
LREACDGRIALDRHAVVLRDWVLYRERFS